MPTWTNILGKGSNGPRVDEDWQLGKVLGKGAYGVVRLVVNVKTQEVCACKSISKAKLVNEDDVEDVQREVQILNLLSDHPHVVGLKATYEDSYYVHLILEICRGGELFDRIVARGTFSERKAAGVFKTMVQTVNHCHQLGVMHRDLKPENFLLTSESDDDLKLADFGLSAFFTPGQKFRTIIGSAYYVAPEVLRRDYGYQADMWSLGVILYILLSGMPPFWGNNEQAIFNMILKGDLDLSTDPWPSVSDNARDLVRRLLTRDAGSRVSAVEVLDHPWLHEMDQVPDDPLDNIVIDRLKRFAAMNKLKKAAIVVAGQCLLPEEIAGLKHLFESLDADKSGTVTVEELRTGLARVGSKIPEEELQALMDAADVDGNGVIDYDEFIAATMGVAKLEQDGLCMSTFQKFDKDNSGFLTPDEILEVLRAQHMQASEEEVKEMMSSADANGDGKISYHEFMFMLRENNAELQRAAETVKKVLGTAALML